MNTVSILIGMMLLSAGLPGPGTPDPTAPAACAELGPLTGRSGPWACYEPVRSTARQDSSNPVRSRESATKYLYHGKLYYGINETPIGEMFTRYVVSLNGRQIRVTEFGIKRSAGPEATAKLRVTFQEVTPPGVTEWDSRSCGPSGPLGRSTYSCTKNAYAPADFDNFQVSFDFGWQPTSDRHPNNPDGYWHAYEVSGRIECRSRRTIPCQFPL
ncbi:hypothetical protein [Thermoactinospora rubra]|uniref:hypothetical protein n=1 Tax=Thermoactinospora rubra TaxID=1088767 RepID=UPI00117D2B47|nr:hypothetical protein [Thermoactinospora rubra]